MLEKPDGSYDRRRRQRAGGFVRDLPASLRPRLVVLASCQSGGQGKVPGAGATEEERSYDQGALAALGPRLVEAGVPAVVAMQDDIRMATVSKFTPAFFAELLHSGQVDKAVALARSLIKNEPDWWVPVLYLRLRGGRLWFESGYASTSGFDFAWKGIKINIRGRKCTPVLGSGMVEFFDRLGARYRYALGEREASTRSSDTARKSCTGWRNSWTWQRARTRCTSSCTSSLPTS